MNNLKHSVIVALLLASPLVGADTQYPAADFQPKVLYKDADYKATASPSTESTSSKKSSTTADDSQYPATDFKPKVLFKDDNYKPSASSASSTATSSRPTTTTSDSVESSAPASASSSVAADSGSKPNYLIILVVLGIVGFVFYKNKPKSGGSKSKTSTREASFKNAGLTGVAKYVNRVSGTGVARYLEKQIKSAPATGVAKYVAKQVITAKTTATDAAATGVEKYVRNRR